MHSLLCIWEVTLIAASHPVAIAWLCVCSRCRTGRMTDWPSLASAGAQALKWKQWKQNHSWLRELEADIRMCMDRTRGPCKVKVMWHKALVFWAQRVLIGFQRWDTSQTKRKASSFPKCELKCCFSSGCFKMCSHTLRSKRWVKHWIVEKVDRSCLVYIYHPRFNSYWTV